MLWHDSGLNLALNCGMMPSLKSKQEAPDFSGLLEIHRLRLIWPVDISITPLRQCLPFSWTTLRGKHCQHPIAIMGVVDTFLLGVYQSSKVNYICYKKRENLNCALQIFCMAVISTKNQSVPNIPTIVIASMGEVVIVFGRYYSVPNYY